MKRIFVSGVGAVSPAGWGVDPLRQALARSVPLPVTTLPRPGGVTSPPIRPVPPPVERPAFLAHPRLRRASTVAQHVVAAALEALGDATARAQCGELRLGVVVTTLTGCVNYSRRFYEEVLGGPSTASPLLFAETVFNAPASHLAAYLNSTGLNYTFVGDDGTYLQGIALAARWLAEDRAEACLVVGAEEMDWVVAEALRPFGRRAIYSAGAGAVCLRPSGPDRVLAELALVTDSFLFSDGRSRALAAGRMFAQLASENSEKPLPDVRAILGEAYNAAAAWQCVMACDALAAGTIPTANIGVVGINQQAIGARFVATTQAPQG